MKNSSSQGQKGSLICISGPSGVGKNSCIQKLLERHPNLWHSVSMTTREPRPQEQEGQDYFFVSTEEFENQIAQQKILEYDFFCGNYYGTPLQPILDRLEDGIDVVLDITVPGALALRERFSEAVLIFLAPPSIHSLLERLAGRGTETEQERGRRIEKARWEIQSSDIFDYVVVNDDLSVAVDELDCLLKAEHLKKNNQKSVIQRLLDEAEPLRVPKESLC